jgi:hypothetical protein
MPLHISSISARLKGKRGEEVFPFLQRAFSRQACVGAASSTGLPSARAARTPGIPIEPKNTAGIEHHMLIAARHVDAAGLPYGAVLRLGDGQGATPPQHVRQAAFEDGAAV